MIIVKLMGGVGNQMFQYAAGRALADRLNTVLKMDISGFAAPVWTTPRAYQLDQLSITAGVASDSELHAVAASTRKLSGMTWLGKLAGALRRRADLTIYNETPNCFDSHFMSLQNNTYLCGYWQSQMYFQDISDVVRREFQPCAPWSQRNLELAAQISATDSISVHVRRGDYVNDESARMIHGVCTLDFYQACMRQIECVTEAPHYYVFSDEPQWARDNIKTAFPITIVDHNDPHNAVFDIKLMSLCKHNIIANSSFSWWGAWLNTNPGKIVFAPSKWFCRKEAKDLLPHSWVKVEP